MVLYRRNRIPGGTYFFTVTLADRSATTLVDHIGHLRAAVRGVRVKHPFTLCAMVVLPDHLHAVLRLPEGDDRYSMRWRMIKADFTGRLRKQGIKFGDRGNGERDLWARRFWEHTIRDHQSLARRIDYLHFNPVKHGYVQRVADWPHSSFHSFVSRGLLPADWAGGSEAKGESNGE
jgi:REP-associated tyrosine transposase